MDEAFDQRRTIQSELITRRFLRANWGLLLIFACAPQVGCTEQSYFGSIGSIQSVQADESNIESQFIAQNTTKKPSNTSKTTRSKKATGKKGEATAVASADWPRFRGPTGMGESDAKGLPLEWSQSENILWKV